MLDHFLAYDLLKICITKMHPNSLLFNLLGVLWSHCCEVWPWSHSCHGVWVSNDATNSDIIAMFWQRLILLVILMINLQEKYFWPGVWRNVLFGPDCKVCSLSVYYCFFSYKLFFSSMLIAFSHDVRLVLLLFLLRCWGYLVNKLLNFLL